MKKPESICIFGDSTAWGAWDMEKGGWVNRLWLYVGNRDEDYVEIYNQSISGGTSETILERFEIEADARGADALMFQTGGNDACLLGENGPNRISVEQFEKNILEIIARAKKITENVMFLGFKNVDESKSAPVSWENIYYLNSELKKYDEIMERVCGSNNVPYLSLFGLLNEGDLEDGVHPNASGHMKIFVHVKDFMIKNGWI